jgi:hypothetical protein
VVSCKAYTGSGPAASFSAGHGLKFDRAAQDEAKAMAAALCVPEAVAQWLEMLLTQLLVLTPLELNAWAEDPERFYADELKLGSMTGAYATACQFIDHLL